MVFNIGIAAFMMVVTTGIHAGAMSLALRASQMQGGRWRQRLRRFRIYWVGGTVLLMFLVLLVEVFVWAAAYLALNAIQGFEQAFYFSMVSFTTLGYGVHIRDVQDVIEVAIGGRRITTTVEGRERYPVRVRYMRELRDQIETLGKILVPTSDGAQIPLIQLSQFHYVRGPQAIKSEDTFLVGYVLFDKKEGYAETDVVEDCQRYLKEKIADGEFILPDGVNYVFAGSYENQIRAEKTLLVVVPLALFIIFLILYFQFKSVTTTFLVFSGIIVAWAGGFLMIWLYGRGWFLDFSIFGVNMRELFDVHPINMSVAIWVGFLALFGIASDNGVIVGTYLNQRFEQDRPDSIETVRAATIAAASRRIRPALMTTATTILALIPVLTSTGRGSDIMVPMAIPSFGGMTVAIVTVLIVPVLYSWLKEAKIPRLRSS